MVNLEHCRNPDQAALISPLLSAGCSLGWEDFTATATAIMYALNLKMHFKKTSTVIML